MNHRDAVPVRSCSMLLALPFLFGCASLGPVAPAGSPAQPQAFRFDWTAPCRVPVVEQVEEKGNTIRFSFVLDIQPAGDKLHVRSDDLRLLSINGVDLTVPDAQRELTPGIVLDATIPTMEVSQTGEFLGAIGIEEEIERELAEEQPTTDPAKHATMSKLMRSPEMRAALETKVADRWETWVGAWVDFGPQPGAPRRTQVESTVFGASVPMVLVGEHLGASTAFPGLSNLRITSTVDAAKSPRALEAIIAFFAQQMDSPSRPPDHLVRKFEKVSVYEVHTDPATLRPARARWGYTMRIDVGEGVRTSRELRDDTFDWAHAEGCAQATEAR